MVPSKENSIAGQPRSIQLWLQFPSLRFGSYANGNLAITDNGYLHFQRRRIRQPHESFPLQIAVAKTEPCFLTDTCGINSATRLLRPLFPTTPTGIIASPTRRRNRIHELNGPVGKSFRTKGELTRKYQPAVRSISQRPGTNIMDMDFEIIDPDDANATIESQSLRE